jgi:hypothetical protein
LDFYLFFRQFKTLWKSFFFYSSKKGWKKSPTLFLSSALTRRKEKQDWKHNKQYWDFLLPWFTFMGEEEQDVIVWKRKMYILELSRNSLVSRASLLLNLRKSKVCARQHKNHSNINMLHLRLLFYALSCDIMNLVWHGIGVSHALEEATVVFGLEKEKLLPCTWCQAKKEILENCKINLWTSPFPA